MTPMRTPTEPEKPTRLHRRIDDRLAANDQPSLWEIVDTARPHTAWRKIAADVYRRSGEDCSDVNLITWFTQNEAAA